MEEMFANVIVDITTEALNKSFVFRVPENLQNKLKPGDKVMFPFGKSNKSREGFLLELLNKQQLQNKKFYKNDIYFKQDNAIENLKEITEIAKNKIGMSEILLKMAIFLCKEYFCPISICLNAVLPVKRVVRKNIRQVDAIKKYESDEKSKKNEKIILNNEQKKIICDIIEKHKKESFDEHLVYGVTGSGKTEVYIEIINEVLKEGKKVIVLIPEIALTHQTVVRLKERFADTIAIIHSKMSNGDRYIQYKKCEDGEANILVGPRSAIFAPFEDLGLVVMDESNDSSYKSETSPRYNTIDVARFRCNEQNATLVCLSATPNVTHYYEANLKNCKIHFHKLVKRANSNLPKVSFVDMRNELKLGNKLLLSKLLIDKINDRLNKHEQIMLYMNRRGYNTIWTCKECGETYKCPHCEVALVSHNNGKLKCHYCGYEVEEPLCCPFCHSYEIEKYGVGTEKLEEMCIELFPKAKILRMDRDTTNEKDGHDKIIKKFKNHEADILIGTQMIIKGHDFPLVTLVGVIMADLSLYTGGYKSSENTFSILTQCVGRSGRAKEGESIIQGYDIDNNVIQQVKYQDFVKFYEDEIKFREKLFYPPFSKLLYIRVFSTDENMLFDFMKNLYAVIETKKINESEILGPTSGNPEKIKDVYNMLLTIKCKAIEDTKYYRRLTQKFLEYVDKNDLMKVVYDIE